MDNGPVDRPRHARLVPRRLGRDDGGDDVPVGRADGRALLAHDPEALAASPARSSRPAICVTWAGAGVLAFALAAAGGRIAGDVLAWDRAGGWVAGATLLVAAVYELTPLKDVCLGKCRSPLGFLLGSWRDGRSGALADGRQERRLVRRLLLGADGVAVRARGDERRLDGLRRRADRRREDAPVAPDRDLRDGGDAARPRRATARGPDAIPPLTIPHDHQMGRMPSMGS